jgi:uncharacterized membrane protein (DUF2068 family)
MEPSPLPVDREDRYLRWIAILNLTKGILLCLLAIGLLGFLHKDLDNIVRTCVKFLHLNMEGRQIVRILAHVDRVTDAQLKEWSGITFGVAAVFIAEGAGLLLRQEWAKYLTIVATSSFVPFEIYEIHRHFSWMKLGVMFVNLGIVAFLILNLLHEKRCARRLAIVTTVGPAPTQPAVGCQSA